MTYERIPGPDSRAGYLGCENIALPITRVDIWPTVAERSVVWFDDPEFPHAIEQWRVSSTIRSIERLA